MKGNKKNVCQKYIALGLLALSLMSCRAENFFTEGTSFNVSGTFSLSRGNYLDGDVKGESSSNAFSSPQGVDGPAIIGGYVSATDDAQDCYRLVNVDSGDNITLNLGEGSGSVSLIEYGRTTNNFGSSIEADISGLLESGDKTVCVEISRGERVYTLDIESNEPSSVSEVGSLTALLVNASDNVRNTQLVAAESIDKYMYTLNGIENSTYTVYLSSDLDDDNIYCEQGDICGELSVGTLTSELTDQNFSEVEICTSGCENIDNN